MANALEGNAFLKEMNVLFILVDIHFLYYFVHVFYWEVKGYLLIAFPLLLRDKYFVIFLL